LHSKVGGVLAGEHRRHPALALRETTDREQAAFDVTIGAMFERMTSGLSLLVAGAGITFAAIGLMTGFSMSQLAVVALAVAMLVVGGWWLGRQPPGTPFHDAAWPAAVTTVMPLLLAGGQAPSFFFASSYVPWILEAAVAAILGFTLADGLPSRWRTPVALVTAALAVTGPALALIDSSRRLVPAPGVLGTLAVVALAATTVVPAIVAGVLRRSSWTSGGPRESVVAALELGVLGVTPAISILTVWDRGGSPYLAVPLVIWILMVLAAQYLAVRPLARTASAATTQRDIVVAAMESERARIAADIHDDALQELTLLGWRLDSAGKSAEAATVREVSERLRAILGDLRLPILDDLGTGPALEWLVDRVGRLSGGDVRLERSDGVRPPGEVELAFFRVAQEALANAVRHGRPPVVVRYWTSSSGASLSVDDAGPGITDAAGGGADVGVADKSHFGLVNMRQRAEQIGALLDVRRWPGGGTRVTLEWRPR
jgi:signal transduction histidine kinase